MQFFCQFSEPEFVAGDGQVVDVLGEVERGGSRIHDVVEGPVRLGAVVHQPGNKNNVL